MSLKILERLTVKIHKRLLDYRLHLTVTFFHIHHHRDRYATCDPLRSRLGEVANERHIARLAGCDKMSGVHTDRVAVVGVEIGRHGTTSLITEEMVQSGELTFVLAARF